MPRNDAAAALRVERSDTTLRFEGALSRPAVAAAWRGALPLVAGAATLDVTAVERVDSAGVALLAELAARAGNGTLVAGDPPGLDELRAAYRLSPGLDFAT